MSYTVDELTAAIQKPAAQPTIGGSVYVKPQDIAWEPTQFEGISIKVLYEDKPKGEMTCLLKWEPGATLPMHRHPEIEQTFVIEGSFYDHDGICRAGEFVWRRVGSFHETHSDEGAVILTATARRATRSRSFSGQITIRSWTACRLALVPTTAALRADDLRRFYPALAEFELRPPPR
jgi:hypothetical protein